MKKILAILLVTAILILPVTALGSSNGTKGDGVGMSISGFHTTDLQGNYVDDSILSEAVVTVINFWASWCGPCVSEMPMFKMLYDYYEATPEADVQVIGVDVDNGDIANALEFLQGRGYEWRQLRSCTAFEHVLSATATGGSYVIPQTIVVDYQGTVLAHKIATFSTFNELFHFADDRYRQVMTTYPPAPVIMGDADGSGIVDANDALLTLRYSLGLITEIDIHAADFDGSGIVDANDALCILRKALGLRGKSGR